MVSAAPCTLLLKPTSDSFDVNECRKALETGSEKAKIEAMSNLLHAVATGESCGSLVMHVIRFVMPNQKSKLLKKLVLLFFEMVPKVDSDGKLLQEMILLWYEEMALPLLWLIVFHSNALRMDLQHPNEFVQGVTLRFVCKLTEPELLEPLLPVVRTCLVHRLCRPRVLIYLSVGAQPSVCEAQCHLCCLVYLPPPGIDDPGRSRAYRAGAGR